MRLLLHVYCRCSDSSRAFAINGYLAFHNFRGSAIRVFSVDPMTAVLTLEGEPYSNYQRAMCWAVLGPDGKTLYASNYVTNNVSVFSIAANGTLDPVGKSMPTRFSSSSVPDSKELQISPGRQVPLPHWTDCHRSRNIFP